MNMRAKTFLVVLLTLILASITAFASPVRGTINDVYVDGKRVNFPDQQPFIDENNRTLVPIRFIAEELGADVGWEPDTRTVTIEDKNVFIELAIGENRAKTVQLTGANKGKEEWKRFDTKAIIVGDRTMVPLRFISETLGCNVEWDGNKREVHITRKEEVVFPDPLPEEEIIRTPTGEGERLLPRHEETYPYAQEWANNIRIENGMIRGKLPVLPEEYTFDMIIRNGSIRGTVWGPGVVLESDFDIKMGDEFEFPVATNDGVIGYTIMRKGSGAGLSSVGMHIPTGQIYWANK